MEVLKGIDLCIGDSELVSIVGSSGAGKTTLLQIMGTLDAPTTGEVIIDGERVSMLCRTLCRHIHATRLPGASVPQPSATASLINLASSAL